jgi:hypothetical protein
MEVVEMSMPYLPGWWDEISKNATGFAQQLPQLLQPNNVAQRKLEQAIQQNPMMLEQIANMDESQRGMIAQGFGFRGQNPFQNIGMGAQREERNRNNESLNRVSSTPQGMQELDAARTGTRTADQREISALNIQGGKQGLLQGTQNLRKGELDISAATLTLKGAAQKQKQVDAAMLKYPDLSKINYKQLVRTAIQTGEPIDPAALTAARQDEGASMLLDLGIKTELMKEENRLSMQLRVAKDPNTSMLLLRTMTELGNQFETEQQRLISMINMGKKELSTNMAYTIGSLPSASAENKAQAQSAYEAGVGQYEKQYMNALRNSQAVSARTQEYANTLMPKGTQMSAPPSAPSASASAAPTMEAQALAAIQARPEAAAQIRASYKAKTGKDLP